jgi:subtilase family serine protease
VTPRFDFQATGPLAIFSWIGDVPIPPGIWYFHLHVSVPTDAPAASYTHRVTMTYNGQTTTKESSFTVGLTGTLPDLSPTAILYDPANLVPGGTVFFDSGVQNAGAQGTGVFNVRWFVDDVSVGYGGHADVPANSTVLDGNSQFSWVATAGTHTIMFAVDVDNHVVESRALNTGGSP